MAKYIEADIMLIREYLITAKNYQKLVSDYTKEIFSFFDNNGIDSSALESNAPNANNLEEAIMCYIMYGEYEFESLLDEIKTAFGGAL